MAICRSVTGIATNMTTTPIMATDATVITDHMGTMATDLTDVMEGTDTGTNACIDNPMSGNVDERKVRLTIHSSLEPVMFSFCVDVACCFFEKIEFVT